MVLLLHLCIGLLWDLSSLSRKEGNNESLPESDFSFADTWWKQKPSRVCQNGTESAAAEGGSSNLLFLIQFVSATWLSILLSPFWSQTVLSVQSGCTSCPCRKWKPQEKTEAPIKHCKVHFRSDDFPVVKKKSIIKIIYFEGRLKHQWKCDYTWTRKSTLVMCIQCLLSCCSSIGCNHFADDVLLWDLSVL